MNVRGGFELLNWKRGPVVQECTPDALTYALVPMADFVPSPQPVPASQFAVFGWIQLTEFAMLRRLDLVEHLLLVYAAHNLAFSGLCDRKLWSAELCRHGDDSPYVQVRIDAIVVDGEHELWARAVVSGKGPERAPCWLYDHGVGFVVEELIEFLEKTLAALSG